MNRAHIIIEASATYGANAPTLEVLVNGAVYSSAIVTATTGVGTDVLAFTIEYPADEPSSLSFRFNDGFAANGRTIEIEAARVNGQVVKAGDLSAVMLNKNDSSDVNIANTDHLFGRTEPAQADLGTATQNGTGGNDNLRGTGSGDIIDAAGGDDRVVGLGDNDAINGGTGNDYLFGSDGRDIIIGGGGNDFIAGGPDGDLLYGQADNDRILGGGGNDVLNGGLGDDRLAGDDGDDIIYGGDGVDRLIGDDGNDYLYGDTGADRIYAGNGNDTIYGGADNDLIEASDGDDEVYGEGGDDYIAGGAGADTIDGGTGADLIFGEDHADNISGGDGDDRIYGGGGDDTLNGDANNDYMVGGRGADTVNGGAGNDMIHGHGLDRLALSQILRDNPALVYSQETNSFYEYVNTAVDWDTALAAAAGKSIGGVAGHLAVIASAEENVFVSGLLSADAWIGALDEANDGTWRWNGGQENGIQFSDLSGSSVNGMYENWDSGQPQNNTEYWGVMNTSGVWHDWEDTSTHHYVIEWEAGFMSTDSANDILNGDAGADYIYGYGGADTINGGDGNDIVFGGGDNDTIDGGTGNDTIDGDSGDDDISGGNGDDNILGGEGDDTIDGQADNDTIYGDNFDLNTIMEAGRTSVTQSNDTEWHSVNFSSTIENAVVKMFAEDVTGDPFTIRVRNITDTGFEFQLDEFDYQDGSTALESISWVAVASGSHVLDNGIRLDAGFVNATNNNSSSVTFNTTFTTPVVFSQLSSDNELSAVGVRNENVSSTGFDLEMREQEANGNAHATEQIGWIAMESGGSAANGMLVGDTGEVVNNGTTTVNFGGTFGGTPIFLADMQSLNGGDTSYTAGNNLTSSQADVYIDEETSNDTETNHINETVGYVVLESGTYLSTSAINGSDTLRGGDGDDLIYADAVEDTNIAPVSGNLLATTINSLNPDAYWDLNETSGTTADNQGGLGASVDGTIIGGATLNAGALYTNGGNSIDFDGVNDGISIPDSTGINNGTFPARSMELVFNADDVTTRQVLFEEGGTTNGLTIYLDGGNLYITGEDDGDWADANINASVSTGTTYHVAFVFSQADNSFTGYLDGTAIGSVTVNNAAFPSHTADIGIGYAPDGLQFHDGEDGGGGYHFDGRISDVAIYNSVLSASEIQKHYDIIQGNPLAEDAIDDQLYGGDGFDQLYGGNGGRDVFYFESASAYNDVDEINGFDVTEQDALDISDLITGYTPGVSDINDFVSVATAGSDSVISVDGNGASGGASFTDIAQINDVTGINADYLLQSNSIIMT